MYYVIVNNVLLKANSVQALKDYNKEIKLLPEDYVENKYIIINGNLVLNPKYEQQEAEKQKQALIKSLQEQLNTIDLKTIRALRAIQSGQGTEDDTIKLEELETQAENIRKQIQDIINPHEDNNQEEVQL